MLATNRLTARNRGFTLIEMLVAIAIFAGLSVAAYQVVSQVQRSNQISRERSERLAEIQRAFVMMDADFRQMAVRAFRTDGKAPGTQLIFWKSGLLDSDDKGLLFTRLGWINPQQRFPRGDVVKVGYRIKDKKLERWWTRYPDTPIGEEGLSKVVLSDITAFDMRFYDGKSWLPAWRLPARLPEAVSIKLTLKDYGEIRRVYLVGGGALEKHED